MEPPSLHRGSGRARERVHEAKDGQEDLMWALVASIISCTSRRSGRRRVSRKTTLVAAALEVTR